MKDVSDRTTKILFWILLAAGAVLRIYGAWCSRLITDPDCGIVALMAKHMAEGREWPVFFYGQAYMGSLEPTVSALFCKLFGVSGFMVNMGPAFVGWLLLPVVFTWARRTAGNTAGLAALAFCVIGPEQFFYFQFAARGGYPIALLFGSLVLMLSARLAVRQRDNPERVNPLSFVLLGLIAGVGWWSNPIIAAALITAALIFLFVLRAGTLSWQVVLPALAGFVIGSLPFWIWNALNGWESFSFLTAFHGTSVRAGLRFLLARSLRLAGLDAMPLWLMLSLSAIYLGASVTALIPVVPRLRRRAPEESDVQLMGVLLFLGLSCLLFVRSHFSHLNTVRYLLPLAPAVAVVLGQATSRWNRILPFGFGWAPLLVLLALQWPAVRNVREHGRAQAETARQSEELAALLKGEGTQATYVNYMFHSMNFLLDEDICFTTLKNERYAPYARRAETAERVAVINNNGGIREFMRYGGGHVQWTQTGGVYVVYGFKPPSGALREIEPDRWTITDHSFDTLMPGCLSDGNVETLVSSAGGEEKKFRLEIEFTEPISPAAVRCVSRSGKHPPSWSIQARAEKEGSWETLTKPSPVSMYFWSGPRPYWDGVDYRLEARVEPRMIRSLRLEFQQTPNDGAWNVAEVQFFTLAEGDEGSDHGAGESTSAPSAAGRAPHSLDSIVHELEALAVDRLYADRWEANKVYALTEGRVKTSLEPRVWGDEGLPPQMTFTTNTALLVREENVSLVRRALRKRNLSTREMRLSPWVLFVFDAEHAPAEGSQGLMWRGYGCLLGDSKRYAFSLIQRAEALYTGGEMNDRAIEMLEEAARLYPYWMHPHARLSKWTGRKGRPRESEAWSALAGVAVAGEAGIVRFANGVEFMGVSPMEIHARPGDSIELKYLWRCPTDARRESAKVFVHFEGNGFMFQDDHPLLEEIPDEDISFQPYFEIFTEERSVRIPPSTPAGKYVVSLGLYDPLTGKRWKPEVKTKVDNRAIVLPISFEALRAAP